MSFFGGSGSSTKAAPAYTGIQLQTSSSTMALALVWGMTRVAPNIFWTADFQSHKEKQNTGKGFSNNGGVSYTYTSSLMLGLGQGPWAGVARVFRDQETTIDFTDLGFSFFDGSLGQAPWGYLTSSHPSEALSYSGTAYLAAANYDLGSSASTPQHSMEGQALRYNTGILANGDADPALCVQDLLTQPEWGAGFTLSLIDWAHLMSTGAATTTGDNSYQTYCRVMGFGISPAVSDQEQAASIIDRWTKLTDCAIVWTGYSLKFIPYGTTAITANGYHYVPNLTAVYRLSDNDYIASDGDAPITVARSDPADTKNSLKLKVKNRDNEYNDAPVEWVDQGLVDQFGPLPGDAIDGNEITTLVMGSTVVSLIGQRQAYQRNTYTFTLPSTFCLLEPMDILELYDPSLGTFDVWIDDIEEQDNGEFQITAKEIPSGLASAGTPQSISNNPINTGADAGPVNDPVIFQPPLDLTNGLAQIWAGISGGDGTDFNPLWGGCFVYISVDATSYQQIGKTVNAARQGILTASLAAYAGTNPDATHTASVSLAMSGDDLQSVSNDEASREATICYVDGELLSFQTATLTGTYAYDLTTLYRGLHGTVANAHASGTDFLRLDNSVFEYTLPTSYIGLTLYFKFQSYNIWGNAVQDLADCVQYTYTPTAYPTGASPGLRSQLGNANWDGATLTVSSDAVMGADTYTYEFYLADGVTLRKTIVSSLPTASYGSAEANTNGVSRVYKVRVKATAGGVDGPWSSLVTFTDVAPPVITGVSATGGVGTGTVSFTPTTSDPDLAGYFLKYSTTNGFNPNTAGTRVNGSGSSPITITGLAPGTYYARMSSYDNWTDSITNYSSQVSFVVT